MGIKNTKLLVCESIYQIGMKMDIKKHIKIALHVLIFRETQLNEKIIHKEIPGKLWEVVGVDMFTLHNKNYLCIVDYHHKFPVIKETDDLSADSLIVACKIIFPEYCLPKRIMSYAGGNCSSDKFQRFCQNLNIQQ